MGLMGLRGYLNGLAIIQFNPGTSAGDLGDPGDLGVHRLIAPRAPRVDASHKIDTNPRAT